MRIIRPISISRIDEVTQEPVSLDELKAQLRITHTDEDTYLTGLISAARDAVETATNRSLVESTWEAIYDETKSVYCGNEYIQIPRPPFKGGATLNGVPVNPVKNANGARCEKPNALNSFTVEFLAGGCSPLAKMAVLLWASHLYETRVPVDDVKVIQVPFTLQDFIARLRVVN